jgi:hypothetical protein
MLRESEYITIRKDIMYSVFVLFVCICLLHYYVLFVMAIGFAHHDNRIPEKMQDTMHGLMDGNVHVGNKNYSRVHDFFFTNTNKTKPDETYDTEDTYNTGNIDKTTLKSSLTLVTALYNIYRADRPFREYFVWFENTLSMYSDHTMVIFCNDLEVAQLAQRSRSHLSANLTHVIMEEDYPLAALKNSIKPILQKSKLTDIEPANYRVEWDNDDYILLQFSKFKWLQHAMQANFIPCSTHYAWVDAGISRFRTWQQYVHLKPFMFPNILLHSKMEDNRIKMQSNYVSKYDMPSNAEVLGLCMGCRKNVVKGTLFGSSRKGIQWLCDEILDILYKDFFKAGIMDNEQAALALLYSREPNHFQMLFAKEDFGEWDYSPWTGCHFICL